MRGYTQTFWFLSGLLIASVGPATGPVWGQNITLTADTMARYQSGPLDDPLPTVVMNPGFNVPVVSNAVSDPTSDGLSFAQADASIKINALGGEASAFSYASGASPGFGPPNDVRATASANSLVDWRSVSQSLPADTPISLKIIIPIDGTLAAAQFFDGGLGPNDVFASASAELLVNNVSLYAGSGRAYDPGAGSGDEIILETGDWVGDFSSAFVPIANFGDIDGFGIDTIDIVTVPSTLGNVFTVDFLLQTEAFTVGPFEVITQANFISTLGYELQAVDPATGAPLDVQFVPVPEPATTVFLCVGGWTLIRRMKKTDNRSNV